MADPGFPRESGNPRGEIPNLLFGTIFAENCMKMNETGPRGMRELTTLFPKPSDCLSAAGMLFRDCSAIHSQWTSFSVLHGTTGNHGAGGLVNSALRAPLDPPLIRIYFELTENEDGRL